MKLRVRILRTTLNNLMLVGSALGGSAIMSRLVLPYLESRGMLIPVVTLESP